MIQNPVNSDSRRLLSDGSVAAAVNSVCLANHTGPFCYKCAQGSIKRTALKVCQQCTDSDYADDRARISVIFAGVAVCLVFVIGAIYFLTYRNHLLQIGRMKKRALEERAAALYKALGKFEHHSAASRGYRVQVDRTNS
jgi:hypothetical protein